MKALVIVVLVQPIARLLVEEALVGLQHGTASVRGEDRSHVRPSPLFAYDLQKRSLD
jgi:hypothetical protein